MAKKNFIDNLGSKNLNKLIPVDAPPPRSEKPDPLRPKPVKPHPTAKKDGPATSKSRTASKPKAPTTKVTTFRIQEEKLTALKAMAYWERKKIQDIFDEALETYLKAVPAATLKKARAEYKKK